MPPCVRLGSYISFLSVARSTYFVVSKRRHQTCLPDTKSSFRWWRFHRKSVMFQPGFIGGVLQSTKTVTVHIVRGLALRRRILVNTQYLEESTERDRVRCLPAKMILGQGAEINPKFGSRSILLLFGCGRHCPRVSNI